MKSTKGNGVTAGLFRVVTVSLFSGFISNPINFLYAPFDQCGKVKRTKVSQR